ncbi:NAD(P)H-binding protein [Glycomyces sp. NPDC049804]|uniref:NAD(P)H-binding protein n=1 Tax=Glycomyces sp. NPDC049804 TaxID=3154363 RepID=UPI003444D90C
MHHDSAAGTILVTGARGNIGSRLTARLAATGHRVRATARDTASLDVPASAETAELDLTDPDPEVLQGVRTAFLYPAFGDITGFLDAAGRAGLEHLVLLSSPAAYDPVEHAGPIGAAHQAIEAAVRDSGLSHTVLYPSWLATNPARDWAEQIRAGSVALAHPEWRINPIHLDDIAEVAAELLVRERFRGRSLILTGPESLSQREVVAQIAASLGTPIAVEELTPEQALAARPAWFPEAMFASLMAVAANFGDRPATVNNNVERVTGRPARPFAEWLRDRSPGF